MKLNLKTILLLLSINAFYFAPVIFSRNTFLSRDIYLFYNPQHFFAAESIKAGTIPLWNPYLACGKPFQANVQSCIFYPLSSIYYLLPFQTGYKYFIVLHYFLGSLFMFLLMREWRYGTYAAMVSALVFAYSGYLVSILDNVCFLASAIWLPLIVVLYHRGLKAGSFTYSLLAGLGISLQIFAGDASFYVLTTFLCLFLYTLLWPALKTTYSQEKGRVRPWLILFTTIASGLLVAAVQIVPMFELVSHSTRFGGMQFETATRWSFHPAEFLQLLTPYVFGTTVPQMRWFGQPWLDTVYLGVFPLIFIIVFVCCCKERIRYFFFMLLLFSVVMSIGRHTPLFRVLYEIVPGINMLQYPVKFLFPATFCLSIMAGAGGAHFFAMLERGDTEKGIIKVLGVFFLLLVSLLIGGGLFKDQIYRYFLTLYPQSGYFQGIQEESFLLVFKGLSLTIILCALFFIVTGLLRKRLISTALAMTLSCFIILGDLALIGKPQDPIIAAPLIARRAAALRFFKREEPAPRIFSLFYVTNQRSFLHLYNVPFAALYQSFQEQQRPNLNMYVHVPTVDEYTDLLNRAYYEVFSPVQQSFESGALSPEARAYRNKILNLLNVKYLISPFSLPDPNLKILYDGPIKIYENTTCLPRAFFVEKVVVVANEDEVLRRLKDPGFDPQRMAHVSKQEIAGLQGAVIPKPQLPEKAATVEITNYQPNQINLKAKTDSVRLLIIADTYYPGWQAYVNGVEKPIVKVNYALRGIFLDNGEQAVTLIFKPVTFIIGACVSLITLVGVLISIVLWRKRCIGK